jgi:hypothetical protein
LSQGLSGSFSRISGISRILEKLGFPALDKKG